MAKYIVTYKSSDDVVSMTKPMTGSDKDTFVQCLEALKWPFSVAEYVEHDSYVRAGHVRYYRSDVGGPAVISHHDYPMMGIPYCSDAEWMVPEPTQVPESGGPVYLTHMRGNEAHAWEADFFPEGRPWLGNVWIVPGTYNGED